MEIAVLERGHYCWKVINSTYNVEEKSYGLYVWEVEKVLCIFWKAKTLAQITIPNFNGH